MRWLWVMVMLVPAYSSWGAGLFGMIEVATNNPDSIPKWIDVEARTQRENLLGRCEAGQCTSRSEQRWYDMLREVKGEGAFNQLVLVNRWANRYPYLTDGRLWGRSDYWETPREFVDKSGDCEDYALVKYYTLRMLGWPDSALRLVVVRDTVRDEPHAILAVKYHDTNYILDNLSTEPLQDKYVTQYNPYYAVNATRRWVFIKPMGQ